jgi:sigma-B regulation protein RsbQ
MSQSILIRNNVKISGKGKQPIIFANGFGCDQKMWRFLTPAFADDYQIILFDYVGSGQSDVKAYEIDRYSDLKGYAQDILDICESLSLSNVILVAHSVSGMIGILASLQASHLFQRLILIGSSPCYINKTDYVGGFEEQDIAGLLDIMEKNYIGWANFLAPIVMRNQDQPELTRELEKSFQSNDPTIATHFAEITLYSDNRHNLSKAIVPSLILQCTDDAFVPVEVGYYLHQYLPKSILKVMQATGHCPHMSHPQETINLLKEYLAIAV